MSEKQYEASSRVISERDELVLDLLREQTVQPLERPTDPVQNCLNRATQALLGRQANDGHWRFDLEADATIPSEYVLLQHFLGRRNGEREEKIARYLRRRQNRNGSWSLYHGGPGDMSATVKAYFALKLMGHSVDAPYMVRARQCLEQWRGGIGQRVHAHRSPLGRVPWRTVPAMPVGIMFLRAGGFQPEQGVVLVALRSCPC